MQRLGIIIAFFIIALAMVFMAVISIQNIQPIPLEFLIFRSSAAIPFGVLLAFSFSLGLILGATIPFVKPLQRLFTGGGN